MVIALNTTSIRQRLPNSPCLCDVPGQCVYRDEGGGICQEPGINRGNSDAHCHRISPRHVLPHLTRQP